MRAEQLISWAATIAVVYAILLATYVATCLVITQLNRRIAGAKIQARETPPLQIRRDQRQSLVSLAAIAAMFGTGHWLYAEFGWGLAPINGFAGSILAFVGSLVLFDTWFYWFHRLIHTPMFYARVHRWHHLTVTPVAWSNNSDRLVDNLFLQSYWLVAHFLIPAAPAGLLGPQLLDHNTRGVGPCGSGPGRAVGLAPPPPGRGPPPHAQHPRFPCP